MTTDSILKVGQNCWKKAQADRAAVLIDGENYFEAFYAAVQKAQHSVYILSWDIDSRVRLIRTQKQLENAELPVALGSFISRVLQHNTELNVYILNWDWAMVYTLEREWLPMYKPEWHAQPRLHFELDGECPLGASQHQKIVVIDDQLAFSGGFDLGHRRWDTRGHEMAEPRRVQPEGNTYQPFHDVMIMVEGEAAKVLANIARQRWLVATGKQLPEPPADIQSAWPNTIKSWFEQVEIAISRTLPKCNNRPEVREVEALYLDSIAAADKLIYFENQYFTSHKITDALIRRLQEEDGPDVVMVLPLMTGGWLEQATMDVLRYRVVSRLRKQDRYNRFRICYPYHDDFGDTYISVHAKVTVIDDKLMRIGSANLSNRSMGLDSECDVSIEASTPAEAATIKYFRETLLAEHFGMDDTEVAQQLEQHGSLIALIDATQQRARQLKHLDCHISDYMNEMLPSADIIDPEYPLKPEDLSNIMIPDGQKKGADKQWWKIATVLVLVIILAALWRWTSLNDWLNPDTLKATAQGIKSHPWTPLLVIAIFSIAGLFAFPVTLLIITAGLTFGPLWGSIYAMAGSLASAMLGYAVGYSLGRNSVQKLAGSRIGKLSQALSKHGVLAIITVRIIPVAPFTVVNLVAGASHIKARDYLIGTAIGMLPGTLGITVFASSLLNTLKDPSLLQIGGFIAIVLVVVTVMYGLKKLLSKKQTTS